MTDRQTTIAIKMLQYLAGNNNYELDGNIHTHVSNGDTSDMSILDDYLYVKNTLEEDYRLIRVNKNMIMLTPDGEAAQRIGFEKYLKSVKNGKQLEITLKRLDVIGKFFAIIKDSKTVLLIVAAAIGGLVHGIVNLLGFHVFPLVRRIAILLLEKIATQ